MANVHSISDYNNMNNNQQANLLSNGSSSMSALNKFNLPFFSSSNNVINPQKETFFQMLHLNFCPRLKLVSFTILITFIDILMFLISSIDGGIITSEQFLQNSVEELVKLGAESPYDIYHWEIYRLITCQFLHANFLHLLFNVISTLFLVSQLEQSFGVLKTVLIYFVAGIGGSIFSACLLNPNQISVGASTCLYGIVGAIVACFILNWKAFSQLGDLIRNQILCFLIMWIILIILFSFSPSIQDQSGQIDNNGHFGGLITGILLGLCIPIPIMVSNYERNCKYIGFGGLTIYFILTFVLFYTVSDAAKYS